METRYRIFAFLSSPAAQKLKAGQQRGKRISDTTSLSILLGKPDCLVPVRRLKYVRNSVAVSIKQGF